MGGSCPGCVDISPQRINSGESRSPRLPTFDSLRLNVNGVIAILFSSGTTGPSKGVMWSDRFLQYQRRAMTYETPTNVCD